MPSTATVPRGCGTGWNVVAGVLVGGVDDPGLPLPPRVLQGLGVAIDVPFVHGLGAGFDIDNLFDVRTLKVSSPSLGGRSIVLPISDFLGFPLPGRTFWATLRFTRPVAAH